MPNLVDKQLETTNHLMLSQPPSTLDPWVSTIKYSNNDKETWTVGYPLLYLQVLILLTQKVFKITTFKRLINWFLCNHGAATHQPVISHERTSQEQPTLNQRLTMINLLFTNQAVTILAILGVDLP